MLRLPGSTGDRNNFWADNLKHFRCFSKQLFFLNHKSNFMVQEDIMYLFAILEPQWYLKYELFMVIFSLEDVRG